MPLKSTLTRLPGLPLLVKELVEQAARRRTYIVRVIYAVLLFLAFAIYFYGEVASRGSSYQMLGIGRGMFGFLLGVQLAGIYFFLPAMMSGVITYEKERRSLELLFITDLGPWEILLQKYAGRLVPMFTFLLLSLPLMAICYSFGGVSSGSLALGTYVLFTTCFQVGAFALMMSAWFRTSSEATLGTYAGGVGLFAVMGLVTAIIADASMGRGGAFMLPMVSVAPFFLLVFRSVGAPFAVPLGAGLLPWGWTLLFLFGAKRFLVTRALLPSRKRRGLFKRLDDWMSSRRKRARGAKRHRYGGELPEDKPIAWREITRTSLGSPGHFIYTSLLLGLPLLAIAAILVGWIRGHEESLGFTMVVFVMWIMAALSISIRSASAFVLERTGGTLDLLLTTPLTGREIVAQKASAVRRRILLYAVLLGALFLAEALLEADGRHAYSYRSRRSHNLGPGGYLLIAVLSVPICLSAASWVARWIGLKVRGRTRATTLTLGVLFSWCVGPFLLAAAVASLTRTSIDHGAQWLYILSPATIVVFSEIANFENVFEHTFDMDASFPVLLSFALHVGVALVFRALCLRNADRYLGRTVPGGPSGAGPGDEEALPASTEGAGA